MSDLIVNATTTGSPSCSNSTNSRSEVKWYRYEGWDARPSGKPTVVLLGDVKCVSVFMETDCCLLKMGPVGLLGWVWKRC